MCFTTHSLRTAHTFVIKDRKLLAMEKYGDALQNSTVVFVLLFKKPPKKPPRDMKHCMLP